MTRLSRRRWERYQKRLKVLEGVAAALALKKVVCNSESFSGWRNANTKCSRCGREVYCNPLFEGAEVKLCLKCDSYLPKLI